MPPFLHMPLAWSAFAVASIPIIIHLLNRRRLRRIDWAAMEFLLAALKKNKRRVRIEQLILLLCRIALMVLLALFLARPLLNDAGLGFLSGVLHSEEKVFVLDDSMSMEQRHTDTTLFGRARSALVDSLRRVVERSKRDVVSIIQTSRPESPRLQGGSLDRERVGAIEQDLETLSVTSTRAELARVIENLAEQSARAAGDAAARPRAISILTDLRASDWTDGGQDANAALLKAFERLVENEERPTRVILLDVGAEETSNVSVVSADITGGRPTLGIPADIQIGVTNHGSTPVSNLRVQLSYVDVASNKAPSMAIAPTITTLAAGETATVSLLCTFQSAGQYRATAEVSGSSDPLPADNKLSFVFDVVEATEILMVNGEPSSEAFEGETDFIASALRPSGEASSGLAPVIAVDSNLPRSELSKYGAIVFANVYQLAPEFLARVGRYVRAGGTLLIYLGDQVDGVVYGRDLGLTGGPVDEKNPQRGLLPATIGELQTHDDAPVSMVPSYEHRYFEFLRDGGERYMQEAAFARYFTLEPTPEAQVIARFSDGSDTPAIVELGVDAGRVLLFASSADTEWNDWARTVTFLPIHQELMRKVGNTRTRHPIYAAGTKLAIPFDFTTFEPRGTKYRGPRYPETPELDLIAAQLPEDAAQYQVEVPGTVVAGLSTLAMTKREGGTVTRAFAVRSDPDESKLQRVTAEQLKRLYPDVDLTVVKDASRFSDSGRGRFEISDVLIALFVALLLVEGFLALLFARHKRNPAPLDLGPLVSKR